MAIDSGLGNNADVSVSSNSEIHTVQPTASIDGANSSFSTYSTPSTPIVKRFGLFLLKLTTAIAILIGGVILVYIFFADSYKESDDRASIFFTLIFVLGLLFTTNYSVTRSGRIMKSKFDKLGNPVNRTRAEIESIVGPANCEGIVGGDGEILGQWQATGFHIGLCFKNNICTEVSTRTLTIN